MVVFSIIVINEKKYLFLESKIENKLKEYINSNYKDMENEIKINNIKYNKNNKEYTIKIENRKNKHLYYIVTYKNRKIKSTYDSDYKKGKTLLNYYKSSFEKILNNTSEITFTKSFDDYPSNVKIKILSNEAKALPIYNIKTELEPLSLNLNDIILSITTYKNSIISNGFRPQYYEFDILFEDITKSFKIKFLTEDLINNNINEIIYDIINNDIGVMQKYQIEFSYLN